MRNKCYSVVRLVCLLMIAAFLVSTTSSSRACSTVMLRHDGGILVGHNLDETTDFEGFVCVNKRNFFKAGSTWNDLKTYSDSLPCSFNWISKYGSVTWSSLGRDLPDAGVNEAGLVIEEMSLSDYPYPFDGMMPRLFQMQWIQFHLDSFSTVEQVVESASRIIPDGWPWHFFVADKSGNCATLEYIDNKLVVHTGETLPVTALCNSTYDHELDRLAGYKGFGGKKDLDLDDKDIPRFVRAAGMLRDYDSATHNNAVDYTFGILANLGGRLTRRSYIVDITNGVAYFRTNSHSAIRHFSLQSFDYSCNTPVRILDMNARLAGDVTDKFSEYSLQANRAIAESWVNHVIEMYPDGSDQERVEAGLTPAHIDRYARYGELSLAASDLYGPQNKYKLTELHWAAYTGDTRQARLLLENGADINAKTLTGTTPLIAALQTGRADTARHLIESKADVNLADTRGNTPLIAAVVFDCCDIAADLIRNGADLQLANEAGLTPLHYAAAAGDTGTAALLLDNVARIETTSKTGLTPLMSAALTGKRDMVKFLLAHGADPHAVENQGHSVLLLSVILRHPHVAEELIGAGADVFTANTKGDTPWSVASANQDKATMKLLAKAGAKPSFLTTPRVVAVTLAIALAILISVILLKRVRANRSRTSSGQKDARQPTRILKVLAAILNIAQISLGVTFLAARGLPTDTLEWIIMAMWLIVPAVSLVTIIYLRQQK